MISDRQRNVFDLDMVAGLVTGVLLLLIAVIIFIGSQIGVRVLAQLPADKTLGPYGVLSFVFTEPVDGSLTLARFSIQPPVKGKFQWADSKTLHFIPIEPYQYGTVYTLAFTPGPLTSTGSVLKKTRSWKFQIRQPLVVYLMENNTKRRLWTIERDSGNASPLTDDSFNIYNFDASRNGEFVIFAAINAQNGIDLWRINRMGGNAVRLLPCSADRCASPVISPDNRRLAYIREAAGPTPDLPYGAPRIRA